MNTDWKDAKRIVVKIGSALLMNAETGHLKRDWLETLVNDIADLNADGREVVLVSSGAVARGRRILGLDPGPLKLEHAQASAAVGQIGLAHAYQDLFDARLLVTAQILLTLGDTEERRRYLNARSTIEALINLGAVPIVNENDTVATNEIRYGDNDRLAARVASMIGADCLILFSDIDGLYTAPPGSSEDSVHIPVIEEITPEIEAMAGDAEGGPAGLSRGGMITKIAAAKIAVTAGTHMIIASGKVFHPLKTLLDGGTCSWFQAHSDPVTARKSWIAGSLVTSGCITIDAGAARALRSGNSLLPAGVTGVSGEFDRGDTILITSEDGDELGRGVSAYSNSDALLIMGRQSTEIADILGFEGRASLVHRDDMVLNRLADK